MARVHFVQPRIRRSAGAKVNTSERLEIRRKASFQLAIGNTNFAFFHVRRLQASFISIFLSVQMTHSNAVPGTGTRHEIHPLVTAFIRSVLVVAPFLFHWLTFCIRDPKTHQPFLFFSSRTARSASALDNYICFVRALLAARIIVSRTIQMPPHTQLAGWLSSSSLSSLLLSPTFLVFFFSIFHANIRAVGTAQPKQMYSFSVFSFMSFEFVIKSSCSKEISCRDTRRHAAHTHTHTVSASHRARTDERISPFS